MPPTRILVVEDESVIAMDVRTRLIRLGYVVPAVAASGVAALQKAAELAPDAVLMDIVLKGDMDGVQAAEQITERFGIPVIYLTAHSDDNTLQRARITEPFGYILKPFEDRELHTTIEMALYRHHMEKQLRASEARFRSLIERSNDVIAIMDADRVIRYCSPSTTQVLGYLPGDMVGKSLFEFLMPEKAPMTQETIRQMLQQPEVAIPIEWPVRHRDSSWRTMLGHVTNLLDDPAILGIVINCHDVTERHRAQEALQQHNRDLNWLNQLGPTLTATLDPRQVAERLMQALVESIGAQGGSLWLVDRSGTGDLICQLAYPDPPGSIVNLHLKAGEGVVGWVAQSGQSAIVSKVSADRRFSSAVDARTGFHTASVLAVPLRVQDQVIGVLEAINKQQGEFDAHDQTLLEMLSTSATIAIENAQLVQTLRQHAAELQARNEELDAFAHTAAHDLKSPVSLIVGFAEVLESDADLFSEEQQKVLRSMAKSGRKMNNIIEEMLLLAGVRQQQVELQPLDMRSILAEAHKRLVDMTTQYQAEIISERPTEWPVALGHAPWVEEVWVNYLSNAIKYGGQPPRIELGAREQPDAFVHFWVHDNGPGLSQEEQTRLFTPFTRLDQVRARGHGLGLSIVRRIVEKLGGQVGVESQVGQGSTFYFDLPSITHSSHLPSA
jgi:PAS domain S-box-containing protein